MPRAKKAAAPPVPRRRRDPEEARAEILDATAKLLAHHPPDAIGLKEIARAVGVSHALISHYFGTYTDLVDAVLERRIRALREAALAKLRDPVAAFSSGELIEALFAMLSDPVYIRLSIWALAGERPSGVASFPMRDQGMRVFSEALTTRIRRERPDLEAGPLRQRVELGLLTANTAAYGYMIGRKAWMGALGKEPSAAMDRRFREALDTMVRSFVVGPEEG
ncbi:MAG: helix-turn-helix domain-containing protein [Minicystis sp.]